MKNPNLLIRTAYFDALQNLVYKTKTIPVYEEQVTDGSPMVSVNIGGVLVQCYIILLNQSSNDLSTKCVRSDEASIQVQINTLFPRGKGGSKTAEEISELVYGKILNESGLLGKLTTDGLWKTTLEDTRNIPYNTDTNSVWVVQSIFTNRINQ